MRNNLDLFRRALVIAAEHCASIIERDNPPSDGERGKMASALLESWLAAAHAQSQYGSVDQWPDPQIAKEEFNQIRKEIYSELP